jgi:hypothetical protein
MNDRDPVHKPLLVFVVFAAMLAIALAFAVYPH